MVKAVTKYIANDGTEFDDQDDALAHESALIDRVTKNYKQYTETSYNGRELLKKAYPIRSRYMGNQR